MSLSIKKVPGDLSPRAVQDKIQASASLLAHLMNVADEEGMLSAELMRLFSDSRLQIAEGLDEAKALRSEIQARKAQAQRMVAELELFVDKLNHQEEALLSRIQSCLEAHPGVPFKDSLGRKAYLQKNPPKLQLFVDCRDKKTVANVIDEVSASLLEVPDEYIKTVSFHVLDTERVKADLQAGKELGWARLEQGQHVRLGSNQ